MASIIPYVTCSGVQQIDSAHYTLTNGALASQALLRILPQNGSIPADVNITFVGGFAAIPLRRCVLDFSSVRRNLRGQIVSLRVWDRRYWWQFGEITGRYNIHLADGSIDTRNKKSLRELAAILLNAAGESNSTAGVLPTNIYPEVEWSMAPPMFALEKLLADYGYELCWNPISDLVHIEPDGTGADLPFTSDTTNSSLDLDVNAAPDQIAIACAEGIAQAKFQLEAVVPEADGTVSAVETATYRPASGWNYQQGTEFEDVAAEHGDAAAALAREGFGKWFRVKAFADGSNNCPGYEFNPLPDMTYVAPLNYLLAETYAPVGSTVKRQKPIYVQGEFLPGGDGIEAIENTEPSERVDATFDLDRHGLIVKFNSPVMKRDGSQLVPATLYLTTSFAITNPSTLTKQRYVYRLNSGGNRGVGAYVEEAEDIQYKLIAVYPNDDPTQAASPSDNASDVNAEALAKAQQVARRFNTNIGRVRCYRDIQPIVTDGAIKQVTWMQTLKNGADTMAGRFTQFDAGSLRQNERNRLIRNRLDRTDSNRKSVRRRRRDEELR